MLYPFGKSSIQNIDGTTAESTVGHLLIGGVEEAGLRVIPREHLAAVVSSIEDLRLQSEPVLKKLNERSCGEFSRCGTALTVNNAAAKPLALRSVWEAAAAAPCLPWRGSRFSSFFIVPGNRGAHNMTAPHRNCSRCAQTRWECESVVTTHERREIYRSLLSTACCSPTFFSFLSETDCHLTVAKLTANFTIEADTDVIFHTKTFRDGSEV